MKEGEKYNGDLDGLRTFKLLYRAELLPYSPKRGYAHRRSKTGRVWIIKEVKFDKRAPREPLLDRRVGKYGTSEFYTPPCGR